MTAETATPFAPFVPPGPTPFEQSALDPPAKPVRKARTTGKPAGRPRATPVRSVAEVKADAAAPKKPGRQKRARKPAAAKAPRAMKLDLTTALSITAGLREADLPLFGHLATTLGTASKKQRPVILAALGKLFG